MIKLFFATFFIAELIISLAVIVQICKFNKRVNSLSAVISTNKGKIVDGLKDFKWMLAEAVNNLYKIKAVIKHKREEYLFRTLKTLLIYLSIFLLKGKYKKSVITFQVLREVYSGFCDAKC